jgi:hypothetical protein
MNTLRSYFTKTLADGRIITVVPLTFGRARLCIGRDEYTYEDGW